MKKLSILTYIIVLALLAGCTGEFGDLNTNPYEISDESLRQDNNHVGAFFPAMLNNIFGDQIEHNLANESFVRHLGTPTPFVGGVNNTTYYIRWNTHWNRVYNQIMAPSRQVIEIAEAENNEVFVAWANLLRVLSTSRLSAYHGPIIYSNYGSTDQTILYDSEPELYNSWFADLDEIESAFTRNIDFGGMAAFDESYGGNVSGWLKLANSIRLRLAMRISKVNPSLAKTQGEKAINAAGGLISSNADNFYIKNYDGFFRPARICFGWGDTRMSATMESVLGGYKDPRVSKYFDPATDATLYPDHPDFPYKGIRNGAELVAKDDRLAYSTIATAFATWPARRCFTSSETHLLLAEAALRGWNTPMSAKEHYETGVRESFAEWGAGGVDAYLQNDETLLPLDYDDPKAEGPVNDFVSRIEVPVKWNDAGDKEYQLEQIMTQKWLAAVHNTIEIWVDHRRTGYPKLPYNYKNDSNADWGVIPDDDFLRRMPFVNGERNNNPDGVADATQKLGGPDEIGTRLWWDTGGPNF